MKLFELITPTDLKYRSITNRSAYDKAKAMRKAIDRNKSEFVGNGAYASVFQSEKDPGSVQKLARPIPSLTNDGYYQYLDMIAKNDRMSNNPYFPKVYGLKTFKDRAGNYTYRVNMEKLHNFNTLSTEELEMLGRKMFTNFDQRYSEDRKNWLPYEGDQNRDEEIRSSAAHKGARDALIDLIERAIHRRSKVSTNIKDPYLKQALSMLRHLVKTGNKEYMSDIHQGNIMVRRGPFTPQIVITDPLASVYTTNVITDPLA